MKKDPYNVLGLQRSATDEEIKSAYRRLARQHHPDLNNNSAASESKFKEISQAYEILGDREKKERFDTFGHNEPEFGNWNRGYYGGGTQSYRYDFGQGSQSDYRMFEDMFSDFLHGDRRRSSRFRGPEKGEDLHYDLRLTFEQAYDGVAASVTVMNKELNVKVPAGVDTGSVVRLGGQGTPGRRGGRAGDLLIRINVAPHRFFKREENDIYLPLPISINEAIFGAKLEIPGPDGRLMLKIPPSTQPGTNFRFKGKGFPSPKDAMRGDFYVTVQVVIPEKIHPSSSSHLEQFAKLNPQKLRTHL
jgi:DnaJ-class molecular chaperone